MDDHTIIPRSRLSCVACRLKKVRCDRTSPCATCRRLKIECIPSKRNPYSSRGRIARAKQVEIQNRLEKLETLIETRGLGQAGPLPFQRNIQAVTKAQSPSQTTSTIHSYDLADKSLGQPFWSGLISEFKDLRQLLENAAENQKDSNAADVSSADEWESEMILDVDHQANASDDRPAHPTTTDIVALLDVYFSNIEPVFKLLHRPSIEKLVKPALNDLNSIQSALECLMFSMYFAAITSLTDDQCINRFREDKDALLAKFRSKLMVAFKRAGLLNTGQIFTLQALVIFLASARCSDNSQFVWTLTSIAVRIGHSLGLHRDGNGLSLPPFEAEIRRRLWWQIYHLDVRSSEDRGSDPIILEQTFDTVLPKNISDDDFGPGLECEERAGLTEITFCLMAHDIHDVARKLNYVAPKPSIRGGNELTMQEREHLALQCEQRVHSDYLVHFDPSSPYQWMGLTAGRLMIARIWLSVYYPLQRCEFQPYQREDTRASILETAMTVMELAEGLEGNVEIRQWSWLPDTHVHWHALSVILAELCVQTQGKIVSRAWDLVEKSYERWGERIADTRRGSLWRPIAKLYDKAQILRRDMLQERRTESFDGVFGHQLRMPDPATLYDSTPTSTQPVLQMALGQLASLQDISSHQELDFGQHALLRSSIVQQPHDLAIAPQIHRNLGTQVHTNECEVLDWQDWNTFIGEVVWSAQTGSGWWSEQDSTSS